MIPFSTILVLGLASYGLATPVISAAETSRSAIWDRGPRSMLRRADDNDKTWGDKRTKEEECANNGDISDWDTAVSVYKNNQIPWLVQAFIELINNGEEDGWLRKSEVAIFGKGDPDALDKSDSEGCADIGASASECKPDKDMECYELYDAFDGGATAFWVYRAVKGAHKKLQRLAEQQLVSTVAESLSIDSLVDDFDASDMIVSSNAWDALAWFGYAMMGISGFIPFLAPGIMAGSLAGALGGTLGLFVAKGASEGKAADPKPGAQRDTNIKALQNTLKSLFLDSRDNFGRSLRLALGIKYDEEEFSDLASPASLSADWQPETPVTSNAAKFFSDPLWIMDSNTEEIDGLMKAGAQVFRFKLIDRILQQSKWLLAADPKVTSKEDCDKIQTGRWINIDDQDACFALWYKDSWLEPEVPKEDDKIVKALKDHEMIDLEVYYREAIRCAESHGSETTDLDITDAFSKELPLCFFSIPVNIMVERICYPNSQHIEQVCIDPKEWYPKQGLKPTDVQVQYCKDKKWSGGCLVTTGPVNQCNTVESDYENQITSIQNMMKDNFECVWYIGPGCENDPYDNQKDAKLGDGSGKHDNSIGSWRCGWKDFGYDRVSNDG